MQTRFAPFPCFATAFCIAAAWWVVGPRLAAFWRIAAAAGCLCCAVAPVSIDSTLKRVGRAVVGGILLGCVVGGGVGPTSIDRADSIGEEPTRGIVRGRVVEAPEPLRRGWGVTVEVAAIDDSPLEHALTARLFVPPEQLGGGRPPLPGDELRVFAELESYAAKRFPGRLAPRRRMARRGIELRGIAEDTVELGGSSGGIDEALGRRLGSLRVQYLQRLYRHASSPSTAYAAAMTAGARGLLSGDQVSPFRRTGTAHLLAISGLHLGILAALLWKAFGLLAECVPQLIRRWGRRRVCAVPVLAVLGAYVWGIGAPVSAFRAFVMVASVVGALAASRPVDSLHGLAAAAVVLVASDPARALTLGFQLSFAATGAILWFLERRPAVLRADPDPTRSESVAKQWVRQIGTAVGVSLSATLATWPVLLAWQGWVPFDALWVNLVVTPLASAALIPMLFAGAVLSFALPAPGAALLEFGGRSVAACASVLRWIADHPPAAIVPGQLSGVAAVALAGGVFVWIGSRGRSRALATGGLIVGLALLPSWVLEPGSERLRLHFIPVGQGDATLIEFPGGDTMLIDAGGKAFGSDPGRRIVAPYLRRVGVGRLDWLVGTHADIDHIGGVPAVARRLRPQKFLYDPEAGASMSRVAATVGRWGTRGAPIEQERHWRIGGVSVRVFRPPSNSATADNDRSLVTVLEYAGTRVVLPADIEAKTERRLRNRFGGTAAIVKVPHHGSRTSSTPGFLDQLRPRVAIVSAGRYNSFGHPHPEVERRYRRRGIEWFETAQHGLVRAHISADGSWSVRTVRRPNAGDAPNR